MSDSIVAPSVSGVEDVGRIFQLCDEAASGQHTLSRPLQEDEILRLEAQGNSSPDWSTVRFTTCDDSADRVSRIRNCFFDGSILIGSFNSSHKDASTARRSGLYNSNFHGICVLADDCYIWNTAAVANAYVGARSRILGCGDVGADCPMHVCDPRSLEIRHSASVQDKSESRLRFTIHSTYADVCSSLFGNQTQPSVPEMRPSPLTIICDDVELISCTAVHNSFIGSYSNVRDSNINSSMALAHCEISSAHLTDAVLHQSCKVLTGAQLNGVLMFPHASVTSQAKVSHSVLGPDSAVSVGECRHSLLGPHAGFHHQALLIASSWPMGRGNIAYGAMIGANHTSRSNDQESFPGEGSFFGLGSSVTFPFNSLNSPYTITASNTALLPQKISFPFSLLCNPDVPYPMGAVGSVKATSAAAANNANAQVQLTSTMSCLKPGWVLISNPFFLEKSMNKFTRRRRSTDYRTDLPIFRPSIADMVTDARNRLLKFKEAQMQSHGRILTPATLAAMLLTDRQLKGAGQCVVSGTSVDPAIDAYTQFLHRYALHGLLYLSAMAAELPPTSLLPGAGAEEPTTEPLDTLLADVRAMQAGFPSMGDHLHQLSAGSTAPPASSSAKASASVYSCAEPAASETPSMGASMLLGSSGSAGCCLLTDTHNPAVRAHQMRVLSEEFPDVDVSAYFQSPSSNPNANKVRQLLKYLCELEQAYAERVRVCKQKDAIRASEIIPDYLAATNINSMNIESGEGLQEDEVIESARARAAEIQRIVSAIFAEAPEPIALDEDGSANLWFRDTEVTPAREGRRSAGKSLSEGLTTAASGDDSCQSSGQQREAWSEDSSSTSSRSLGAPSSTVTKGQVTRYCVPGPSWLPDQRSARGSKEKPQDWAFLKDEVGWRFLRLDRAAQLQAYVVPRLRDTDSSEDLIENLEFFGPDTMTQHIAQNPCLVAKWPNLWERLRSAGWRRFERNSVVVAYGLGFSDRYLNPAFSVPPCRRGPEESELQPELEKGLEPGLHLFVSKAAVVYFIARFPYLLQDDATFASTLGRNGWRFDEAGRSVIWPARSIRASAREKWQFDCDACSISLVEVRRRLWLCPHLLFQEVRGQVPDASLIDAIRLQKYLALQPDPEPNSPAVKGLSREERNAAVKDLHIHCKSYVTVSVAEGIQGRALSSRDLRLKESSEKAMQILLTRLGWRRQRATWSSEWWAVEEAWTAPWLPSLVEKKEKPTLGRDFFWTLMSVAEFPRTVAFHLRQDPDFSVFLARPPCGAPPAMVRAEELCRTNAQLQKLAHNSKQPFAEWPVAAMLESTGWVVFRDSAVGCMVFIPPWSALFTDPKSYAEGRCGVEYFTDEDDYLIDHLVEFGNEAPREPSLHGSSSSSSEDEESDYEPQKASRPRGRVQASSEAVSSEASSQETTFEEKGPAADSIEGKIAMALAARPRFFSTVFTLLKTVGWRSAWCKKLREKLILPPWAFTKAPEAFTAKSQVVAVELLQRHVDYFEDTDAGKQAMMEYLDREGLQRLFAAAQEAPSAPQSVPAVQPEARQAPPSSRDPVRETSPEQWTLPLRSPAMPCYGARDPSEEVDRLLGTVSSSPEAQVPMTSAEDMEQQEDEDGTGTQCSEESEASDSDHTPPVTQEDLRAVLGLVREEKTEEAQRKKQEQVQELVICEEQIPDEEDEDTEFIPLTQTAAATSMKKSAPQPHRSDRPSSKELGASTGAEHHSTSSAEKKALLSTTRQPASPPRKIAKTSDLPEQRLPPQQLSVGQQLAPPAPARLLDLINQVREGLRSASSETAYQTGHTGGAPIGREEEYGTLHSAIIQCLHSGRGGVIHLSGCSGMGKTLTTTLALGAISASAAKSPGMLAFRVVWLNGAGASGLGEMVRAVAGEIGLDPTLPSTAELRGAVEKVIRTPIQRRGACVPLLVLVVDEVDLLKADAAEWLLLSAISSTSSLLLVGMGNTPAFVRKYIGTDAGSPSPVTEINFRPYSSGDLNDILEKVTRNLFARPARSFLAGKVISINKHDVRALLRYAEVCIDHAASDLSAEVLSGACREIVTMKHVQTVFQALVTDKLVGVLNEMSPPLCRYLVVALFVKGSYLEQHGFSLTAIASAFNAYLLEKGQAPQPTDRVRGYLDQLVLYAVVKIVKESQDVNKVRYQLCVDVQSVLKIDQWGEMLLGDLRMWDNANNGSPLGVTH